MAGRADARSSQHPRCVVSGGTERSYCMPCRESDQYDEDLTHAILDGEDQGIIRHPPAMGCQPHMADPVKEQRGADPDKRGAAVGNLGLGSPHILCQREDRENSAADAEREYQLLILEPISTGTCHGPIAQPQQRKFRIALDQRKTEEEEGTECEQLKGRKN